MGALHEDCARSRIAQCYAIGEKCFPYWASNCALGVIRAKNLNRMQSVLLCALQAGCAILRNQDLKKRIE